MPTEIKKNRAAVMLGRLGGLKGGQARAAALTPERRKEIARLGGLNSWKNRAKKKAASGNAASDYLVGEMLRQAQPRLDTLEKIGANLAKMKISAA